MDLCRSTSPAGMLPRVQRKKYDEVTMDSGMRIDLLGQLDSLALLLHRCTLFYMGSFKATALFILLIGVKSPVEVQRSDV